MTFDLILKYLLYAYCVPGTVLDAMEDTKMKNSHSQSKMTAWKMLGWILLLSKRVGLKFTNHYLLVSSYLASVSSCVTWKITFTYRLIARLMM